MTKYQAAPKPGCFNVPKAGIIYNDVKPIAGRVAIELKD
ncbi:MAG: NAD(+) kinase, partial [Cylindrospermopsis raciborskii]